LTRLHFIPQPKHHRGNPTLDFAVVIAEVTRTLTIAIFNGCKSPRPRIGGNDDKCIRDPRKSINGP
jgi:hypothetical protein